MAEGMRREQSQRLTAINKQEPIGAISASQVAGDDVETDGLVAAARGGARDECRAA